MNKSVYLTFDIETIVSPISKSREYISNVYLAAIDMAIELKKRNLKATFYIALSPKMKEIDLDDYWSVLEKLICGLKQFDNICIQPHLHAYNLPVSFETKSDKFSDYNHSEQIELLRLSSKKFAEWGVEVNSFRPGGFNTGGEYYSALKEAGFSFSSVLNKEKPVNINLVDKTVISNSPFEVNGILEYPVTKVLCKSIKQGKLEELNLSPDFFTIESVESFINQLSYVNVNFHSFSMYSNRLARENHQNQTQNNIRFLLFEKWVKRWMNKREFDVLNCDTLFRKELLKWLDFFQGSNFETKHIGE